MKYLICAACALAWLIFGITANVIGNDNLDAAYIVAMVSSQVWAAAFLLLGSR